MDVAVDEMEGQACRESATAEATAIEPLLRPLLPQAYGVALRLTRNPADADDLLQEACFLAIRGFGTFEHSASFRPWFYRILHNAFHTSFRKRRREGVPVELDAPMAPTLDTDGKLTPTRDPADALVGGLTTAAVVAALDSLPDEFREACTLYLIEDLSYEEVAHVLDIPIGTVRSRLHRGRKLLQQRLRALAADEGIGDPPPAGRTP